MRRPAYDRKLQLVDSWVEDVQLALKHCRHRRSVVQAGGAYGVWPIELSNHFASVHTFEPDCENFACLSSNTADLRNVHAYRAALGSAAGSGSICRDAFEVDNAGAGYVVPGFEFHVVSLDSMGLIDVDLICLDVEGFELFALQGAEKTIEASRPVIMVEAKELPQMRSFGVTAQSAIDWLTVRGYEVVERVHRDVVMRAV